MQLAKLDRRFSAQDVSDINFPYTTYHLRFKRAFDIFFSCLIMVLFLPLFLLIYLCTLITTHSNPIYKQVRLGKNAKPFYIYKFKTMLDDAEQGLPLLASKNDPRITRFGKFMRKTHLDELPQFYNVLKGEMSVVGPRPERNYFAKKIRDIRPEYQEVYQIKPGITSIGQVIFGYAVNVEQMVQRAAIDRHYMDNICFSEDLYILYLTSLDIFKGKGF